MCPESAVNREVKEGLLGANYMHYGRIQMVLSCPDLTEHLKSISVANLDVHKKLCAAGRLHVSRSLAYHPNSFSLRKCRRQLEQLE